MKRGQLDQPFVIIFALVVGAVILILGYYSVTNLMKTAGSVETAKFYSDLKRNVNIYYDFAPGSNALVKLNVPDGIRGVCFVELDDVDENNIKFEDVSKLVKAFKNAGDYNVFFSVDKDAEKPNPLRIDRLKPKENPLCKDTFGGLEIILTNKGRYVEVS